MKVIEQREATKIRARKRRKVVHAIEGAAGGAAVGAAVGIFAGPAGAIAGALLGGAAGAVAERILERGEQTLRSRNEKLDEEIGVTAGDIGAPNLEHPPEHGGVPRGPPSGPTGSQGVP